MPPVRARQRSVYVDRRYTTLVMCAQRDTECYNHDIESHADLMRKLRELVSREYVRVDLISEGRWIEVCDAMDEIQDFTGEGPEVPKDQRAAINRLQSGLSIEPTQWSGITTSREHESSVLSSIEAVVIELGDRSNRLKARFGDDSAARHLTKIGYHVGKISEATGGLRGGSGTTELGLVNIVTVKSALTATAEAIKRRGPIDAPVESDLLDAAFILDYTDDTLRMADDPKAVQTADLLASFALPALMKRVHSVARSLDQEYQETDEGWDLDHEV